jgi:hypothetical protein
MSDDECTAADAMNGLVFASLAGMISALDIARHFAVEAGYLVGD